MSIYIGNLSYDVEEFNLREVFGEYGTVSKISIPLDRESNRKRGFAFVEMSSDAQEETAIEKLDGTELMGRSIKVNKAKPHQSSNDSRRGGYGGRY